MKDFEFLKWIYERLRFRHGERQDVDYMIKLKSLVEELKASGLDGFEKTKISSANIIYNHPTTIAEFESVYREEYKQELEGCDRWIKWCEKRDDTHGVNFHQGMRSAHVFNNIKMEQLLRVLKQEEPNRKKPATGGRTEG